MQAWMLKLQLQGWNVIFEFNLHSYILSLA